MSVGWRRLRPEEKGIETKPNHPTVVTLLPPRRRLRPDEKGIETDRWGNGPCRRNARRRLRPDEKGIETLKWSKKALRKKCGGASAPMRRGLKQVFLELLEKTLNRAGGASAPMRRGLKHITGTPCSLDDVKEAPPPR